MRIRLFVIIPIVFFVIASQTVQGAFILEMSSVPSPAIPGSVVFVTVTARSDTGAQLISGFDLKFDLQPPGGVGRPAGITNAANFITNPVFPTPGTVTRIDSPTADIYVNGDYAGNAQGPFISIGAAPTTLFTMNFDLASNLAAGTYTVLMVRPGGAFGVYDSLAVDVALPAVLPQALINITAVPEPSSATLFGIGLAIAVVRRARKRRDSSQNSIDKRI